MNQILSCDWGSDNGQDYFFSVFGHIHKKYLGQYIAILTSARLQIQIQLNPTLKPWTHIQCCIWVIDQAFSVNMAGYWPNSFFCLFMDRDGVEVNKLAKQESGQYPTILTKQTWSIKDFLWLSGKCFLRDTAGSP